MSDVPVPVVAVASYGRAGRVSTVRVFPEGVIVVPEKQEDSYRALQDLPEGWEIRAIPDADDGNLCRKRNAILRMFRGQDVVIVDDDYDHIGKWEGFYETAPSRSKPVMALQRTLAPAEVRHLLWQGAVLARDLGTPFWGINVANDRRFYRPYTPFSITNIVLGPFQAFTSERPDDLLYDEGLWLKEDYDLSLRVLQRWHRILRLNAFYYSVDHFNEAGGQVGKRNMEEEVRQVHALQRRWGSDVVKLQLHRSVNPIIKVPIKGV